MGEILEMFGKYQLAREDITDRVAFSLLAGGQIVRVWWDKPPSPDEVERVIKQLEGAIAR